MKYIYAVVFFLAGVQARAFPENIRHGYVNCTSCHVSPTGGGTLTPYGRALSAELMSTWSYKNESGFLHGAIAEEKMPEWLMVGGDLRGLQTLKDTKTDTTAKWIPMGEDIEFAVKAGPLTEDLEFGKIETPDSAHWGSHRFFAMYNITDEWTVRAGRFYPEFGLYIPDHYVPPRRGLGFDEGMERNSAEVAWNGENYSAFFTASRSSSDVDDSAKENGYSAQINKNLGDSSKIGVSAWYGKSDQVSREIAAVHGMFGFTKKLYLLSEFDHQWMHTLTDDSFQNGLFAYDRLGYEFTKGLILFAQAEYGQSSLSNGGTATDAYGPGFQWFPRPHFELLAIWRKTRTRAQGADFNDYAFAMAHYYW